MYHLTERRLATAKTILDNYRAKLFASKSFDAQAFERELRDLWNIGYQDMKPVSLDMLKKERYREVAAHYMEHSNPGTGVAAEFKPALATLYGAKSFHAAEYDDMRERFWTRFFE